MVSNEVLLYSYCYIGVAQSLACWVVFLSAPHIYDLFAEGKPASDYTGADIEAERMGMTAYYWTLVLGQVGAAVAATTTKQSVFQFGMPNWGLNLCIVLELLLALAVLMWPPLQAVFKTRQLTSSLLIAGMLGFFLIFNLEELRKLALRCLWPQQVIRA